MADSAEAIKYPLIPTIVFGDQRLARLGISERELTAHPEKYHSQTMDLSSWYTYQRINDRRGQKSSLSMMKKNKIAAITCLSQLADEVINYLLIVFKQKKMTHERN